MHHKLKQIFKTSVLNVHPTKLINSKVFMCNDQRKIEIFGNVFDTSTKFHIVGFGKAVLGMATVLQDVLKSQIKSGVLSVPVLSEQLPVASSIKVYQGAKNNLPDMDSMFATDEILRLVNSISAKDVILVLISGGGSSLFCKPAPGISLTEKLQTISLLTEHGANIHELNTVRKKISAVKGGQFGSILHNNQTICLILSDVIGDPLNIIASGPTVRNTDSNADAMRVVKQYNLEQKMSSNVLRVINADNSSPNYEINGANIHNIIIGSNAIALESAKRIEESSKCKIIIVSSEVSGLVADVGKWYAELTLTILNYLNSGNRGKVSGTLKTLLKKLNCQNDKVFSDILNAKDYSTVDTICLLMGGETTVRLKGNGKGGRNQELAVIVANYLYSLKLDFPQLFESWSVSLLCAGTDGIDGPTDVAGAIGSAELIERGNALDVNVDEYLSNNDTYTYLSMIEDGKYFVKTGHTGTNVMDIHILGISKNSVLPVSKL